MAHLKKNTRGAVPGLAVHFERKTDHHTNKEIDVSKSYLNQDLMSDGSDMLSRFSARLNDVYCMKRDDVKALATYSHFTRRTRRSALRATERLF
nr:plasmid recombination protein [Leuconostoc lactis]